MNSPCNNSREIVLLRPSDNISSQIRCICIYYIFKSEWIKCNSFFSFGIFLSVNEINLMSLVGDKIYLEYYYGGGTKGRKNLNANLIDRSKKSTQPVALNLISSSPPIHHEQNVWQTPSNLKLYQHCPNSYWGRVRCSNYDSICGRVVKGIGAQAPMPRRKYIWSLSRSIDPSIHKPSF